MSDAEPTKGTQEPIPCLHEWEFDGSVATCEWCDEERHTVAQDAAPNAKGTQDTKEAIALILGALDSYRVYTRIDGDDEGEADNIAARKALAVLVAQAERAENVVTRWQELGRCEDEFGALSPSCGEYAELLDEAIAALAEGREGP